MASTPDFSTSHTVPAWRQKLSATWRWWTDELARMVPESFARGTRLPVLALDPGGDVVLVEPKSATGPEARVAAMSLDTLQARAALAALLARVGETRSRARLCLDREEALLRRVSMPAATEENLSQVMGFEMDRLTPFRADEVYFDQRVVSRDAAAAQILVQVAVARRELVDARVARMRELGVSVQGVTVRDDAPGQYASFDLLPHAQRGERESPNDRLLKHGLIAAVVVLLLAALALPIWQKREGVIEVQPLVARAQQDAQATDNIGKELERQVADYNYLLTRKHAWGALSYLEDVSRLLPDNTWVQQFDLRAAGKSREVQITGETTSSSKLIELLEQSTLLQNATPRGTVTRGSTPGTERFMIAAETRPRALPAMLAARDLAAPPPPAPVVQAPAPAMPASQPKAEGDEETGEAPAPATGANPATAPHVTPSVATPPPARPPVGRLERRAPASPAQAADDAAKRFERTQQVKAAREELRRQREQARQNGTPPPTRLPTAPPR
ncbi:MAG: pilus assembly protein PilM [Usitatibacter sp.]